MRKSWNTYLQAQDEDRVTLSGITGFRVVDFMPDDNFSKVDWYIPKEENEKEILYLIEHRRRYKKSTKHGDTFISRKKLKALEGLSKEHNAECFFITFFDDAIYSINIKEVKVVADQHMIHRSVKHKHDNNDSEQGYLINLKHCVEVDGKNEIFCD